VDSELIPWRMSPLPGCTTRGGASNQTSSVHSDPSACNKRSSAPLATRKDGNRYPRPETRNSMGFFSIRVRVRVNFSTCEFVNGAKARPNGFVGMGLGM
jgi:hypothetical protein